MERTLECLVDSKVCRKTSKKANVTRVTFVDIYDHIGTENHRW